MRFNQIFVFGSQSLKFPLQLVRGEIPFFNGPFKLVDLIHPNLSRILEIFQFFELALLLLFQVRLLLAHVSKLIPDLFELRAVIHELQLLQVNRVVTDLLHQLQIRVLEFLIFLPQYLTPLFIVIEEYLHLFMSSLFNFSFETLFDFIELVLRTQAGVLGLEILHFEAQNLDFRILLLYLLLQLPFLQIRLLDLELLFFIDRFEDLNGALRGVEHLALFTSQIERKLLFLEVVGQILCKHLLF